MLVFWDDDIWGTCPETHATKGKEAHPEPRFGWTVGMLGWNNMRGEDKVFEVR